MPRHWIARGWRFPRPLPSPAMELKTPFLTVTTSIFPHGEEETETPKPVGDASCLSDAEQIQERISRHVPVDTEEDWSDVDFPEILLEDLGIQAEEASDVFALSPPEPRGEEDREESGGRDDWIESVADEALIFISDLLSYTNDPQTQYVRDIGPKKVLSRVEEIDLAREISEGRRKALGAIPRSPTAMAELLHRLESVERGDASIQSIIGTGGNTKDDAVGQEEPADEDETDDEDDEDTDDGLEGGTLDILFQSEILPEIRLKFEAVRTIHDAMAEARSTSEREVLADRLGDALHGLGASSDFMELLWSKIRSDDTSHDAKEIMDRGLGRAQAAKTVFAVFNQRLVLWLARKYRDLPLMGPGPGG